MKILSWPPRSPGFTPADHDKAILYLKTINTRGDIWRFNQAVATKIYEPTLNFGVTALCCILEQKKKRFQQFFKYFAKIQALSLKIF